MTSFKNLSALILCLAANAVADSGAEKFWPQWRGPLGTGVGPQADPPLNWSEPNSVKWKLALPGEGDSTPIVWADRLFVLCAVAAGKENVEPGKEKEPNEPFRFTVLCVDRGSGKILWQKV